MPAITIDHAECLDDDASGADRLRYVEQLLGGRSAIEPKFRATVELKVFMGMTLAESAQQLNCSERTAATYWSFARRWLAQELDRGLATPGTA
jgi:DNA-directed RNA polymerase specialized sigma24 family protein